ncbi:hypothetical protein I578_01337 [Lactococcus garvieae ATCC 49156]|nr:hypothetical protein OO3_00948 [Lactococcus garvieae ATCC 49156]EOT93796.1 hypothetical protein I578_01337 [Lactococcus garvieae ATCC 49156]
MLMLTFLILVLVLIFLVLMFSLGLFMFIENKNRSIWIQQPQRNDPLYAEWYAFMQAEKEEWYLQTHDNLTLKAWYLPATKPTNKTILLANGYKFVRDRYGAFGWLFHDLGYNVLMPDYRAGAKSPGKFIGFGWLDRKDNLGWIKQIIEKKPESEIAMFGISMGASATMMLSGEDLPEHVKCFIEDCGYDTVWNELAHKAKHDYHLPPFPLIHLLSFWSKLFAGYDWKEASSITQLNKNTKPFLFIHGDQDTFVPMEMVYRNYEATKGPKEIYIAKGGRHVRSYEIDKEKYREAVANFLKTYL